MSFLVKMRSDVIRLSGIISENTQFFDCVCESRNVRYEVKVSNSYIPICDKSFAKNDYDILIMLVV